MHAQLRVQNINTYQEITRLQVHNNREHEERGYEIPRNIIGYEKAGWGYESYTHVWYKEGRELDENYEIDLARDVQDKFAEVGIKPRKGAVIALEYVVGFSVAFMRDLNDKHDYSIEAALLKQIKWIWKKHGPENIISVSMHFDESNPHAHVLVVPLVQKKTKWQLRREMETGIHEEAPYRLCAKDFTGGPMKLSQMQDEFYEHCTAWTKSRFGVELTKHKKASLGLSYENETRAELGEIRAEIVDLEKMLERVDDRMEEVYDEVLKKIKEKKLKLEESLKAEKESIGRRKDQESLSARDLKDIKYHKQMRTESDKPLIPKKDNEMFL